MHSEWRIHMQSNQSNFSAGDVIGAAKTPAGAAVIVGGTAAGMTWVVTGDATNAAKTGAETGILVYRNTRGGKVPARKPQLATLAH
jgi:hypothetical protein